MSVWNCPICLVGVVEIIGYVELKEGPLEFMFGQVPQINKAVITIGMCSRGSCEFVSIGTVPGSFPLAKGLLRCASAKHKQQRTID